MSELPTTTQPKPTVETDLPAVIKAAIGKVWKRVKAMRPFTSSRSFVLMMIGFGALGVLIFGGLMFAGLSVVIMAPLFIISVVSGIALIGFALACAVYLTITRNWYAFRSWFALMKATRRDRKSSVIYDPLIARRALTSASDTGIKLTMAPASTYPKYEEEALTYEDDRHVFLSATSRSGKGTSVIVPNLLHHKGSVVVFDPAGENFALTAAYRQQVLGQKIVVLDPFNVTDNATDTWNPFAEIDPESDPHAMSKYELIAESLQNDGTADPYWSQAAQTVLSMVAAHLGTIAHNERQSLTSLRDQLMSGELERLWASMEKNPAYDGVLSGFGSTIFTRNEKELSSVLGVARNALRWLNNAAMGESTARSTFSMRELKEDKVTLYIVLPAAMGDVYSSWLRLIFNAAFDAMQDMSVPTPDEPVLFMMDEFPLLGRMERIKKAAGEAAKFGVKLFICVQSIGQLQEIYGQGWETFIANSGLLIMFASNDLTTQEYLSKRLGIHKEEQKSYSHGAGGRSTSTSWATTPIARPDQIESNVSRESGMAYFFIPGFKPMCLPRATYYDWDMIPEGLKFEPFNASLNPYIKKQEAA